VPERWYVDDVLFASSVSTIPMTGPLTVEHSGPLPDRFQERLETIVTGTLADDGTVLHATDLVAKCPDDYSTLPSWPDHGGPR
jgi:cytochrome c-type biogenesis protein CcmE